jgi:maltose alpha-D-glucosyltransferase/alpha-amylase
MAKSARVPRPEPDTAAGDPYWYKDAVIYQLHVRSFFDSDNDGIGDFAGLTRKLDYLQDLGVTALWLLPFYPSPLKDDGYDIADYTQINPSYGTLADFREFVREAHQRGLRVINELVLNHTSDQHPWFQRARRAKPGSPARDFYVWSDTPEKYTDARIIFKDFEVSNWSWDPLAKAYYWHRFYAHQPDLNFDNPKVHEALFGFVDYWLKMGVDGMRLDAVPYLYEREGTNCENLPETHAFLKKLRKHIDQRFPGRMLLAEANQWPEDAIAYFGDGDECHTAFHFPVMPRLFMGIQMEDRYPILDILQQTPPIPEPCQWLVFLRNHDELTLEMVTDEERDYMWRAYAHDPHARINLGIRRRLAPLLRNDRRKIELMNGLLCSLPGTPVIYYGDEIGMGDNIYLGDRHGVRTPMQWSPDRNAGFSGANPQRLYSPVIIDSEYLFETVNVETQQQNPYSLLWWMKRLISLRQLHPALGRGAFEPLTPKNSKVLAFLRRFGEECILVVANLSRFNQYVELDLSGFASQRPQELFGQTRFPAIGKLPYLLTLGPHAFYWFALKDDSAKSDSETPSLKQRTRLSIAEHWHEAFQGRLKRSLEAMLLDELPRQSWFRGKSRSIQSAQIVEIVPLEKAGRAEGTVLLFVRTEYGEGEPEVYLLLVACAWGDRADQIVLANPQAILAIVSNRTTKEAGVLYDALAEPAGAKLLMSFIAGRRHVKGDRGELVGSLDASALQFVGGPLTELAPAIAQGAAEQSNNSIVFGDKLVLKLFRRMETGINPELEMGRVLSTETHLGTPRLMGALEYVFEKDPPYSVAVLQSYVPNSITAWRFTLDFLGRYLETVMALPAENRPKVDAAAHGTLWELARGDAPQAAKDLFGGYLESAALLGRDTADLHLALASADDPGFAPEPFNQLYQRSLYQSARKTSLYALRTLRGQLDVLTGDAAAAAQEVLGREREILDRFRGLLNHKIVAQRIRCHGDYHLAQVLYTGKDFVITDFEGEPDRPLAARRLKRSGLQDVAAMIRSFHYAASQALFRLPQAGTANAESVAAWRDAAEFWYLWSSSAFIKSYAALAEPAGLLPGERSQIEALFQFHLFERAIYELGYELNKRPEHAETPLRGILQLLSAPTETK